VTKLLALSRAREAKALTQQELARRIDVGVEVIQRLERGSIEPGPLLLGNLEKALGIPRQLLLQFLSVPTRKADPHRRGRLRSH
jgi:ribosome-binding protein aMBF1 (putative translation factor)